MDSNKLQRVAGLSKASRLIVQSAISKKDESGRLVRTVDGTGYAVAQTGVRKFKHYTGEFDEKGNPVIIDRTMAMMTFVRLNTKTSRGRKKKDLQKLRRVA